MMEPFAGMPAVVGTATVVVSASEMVAEASVGWTVLSAEVVGAAASGLEEVVVVASSTAEEVVLISVSVEEGGAMLVVSALEVVAAAADVEAGSTALVISTAFWFVPAL